MRAQAFAIPALAVVGITLGACTNTDNPQLAMCQAVTKQLTSNAVSSWDKDSSEDGMHKVTVKVAYTNASGQAGNSTCYYPKHEDGTIDTAPDRVVWNNQSVDTRTLVSAGTKASAELLAGTYKNTVEASAEFASQASEKASELAIKAQEAAVEGAKTLQELQQK